MKINFKQPKYILPLILLPFFCLFFFVYHSMAGKKVAVKEQAGLNSSVGKVSGDVQKKQLEDKLEAYQKTYKQSDGMTAVTALKPEQSSDPTFKVSAADRQRKMLDSLNQVMKANAVVSRSPAVQGNDRDMAAALNNLRRREEKPAVSAKPPDPMETFRQQMAYLDSMNRANDPAAKAERQKKELLARVASAKAGQVKLSVRKVSADTLGFNTVMPPGDNSMIRVIIDENVTGYAGSRIRLRLLDDIQAGHFLVPKNSYVYALVNGFAGQRVTLSVTSILVQDKILPVKLDVYDLDGLLGLYVPESAFRDFTKDLGQNSVQGVTLENSGSGSAASQFMMSGVSKLFESTSSAIAGVIRKNKAKLKYNSYLYLLDSEALQNAQHNY